MSTRAVASDGRSVPFAASRENAFDLLRLFGALLVIVEHSWALTGHPSPLVSAGNMGFGGIGVGIFFLISGFLISSSWLSDPSPFRFVARRVLRIYPAFFVVVTLLAFVLGPLFTRLSLSSYFTAKGTYFFFVRNLLIIPMNYDLPGVFHDLPFRDAVDGSLWTIRIEVLCYAMVMVLGILRVLNRRSVVGALAVTVLAILVYTDFSGYSGRLVPHLLGTESVGPIFMFLLGILARLIGSRAVPRWWMPVLFGALWTGFWGTPIAGACAIGFVASTTLFIAFRSPARVHHPTGRYDLSYGTYIMAFPVQQCLVYFGIRQPLILLVVATAVVLPLAALSWRFIERPALRAKPGRSPARVGEESAGDGEIGIIANGWRARLAVSMAARPPKTARSQ